MEAGLDWIDSRVGIECCPPGTFDWHVMNRPRSLFRGRGNLSLEQVGKWKTRGKQIQKTNDDGFTWDLALPSKDLVSLRRRKIAEDERIRVGCLA